MKNLLKVFRSWFQNNDSNMQFQTFTYFIPSPPARKSGYQEKQFDRILSNLLNGGYSIIDYKTESITGPISSGIFVIFHLKSNKNTKTIESLLENLVNTNTESMEEGHKLPSQSGQNKPLEREIDLPENRGEQDKVEGIYYID